MPPTSPANTTVSVTEPVSTRPLAMVAATLNDRNAPTRFSTPESATATFGGSAPVAMDVAIALPVSWKPLVKSKASAVITTSANKASLFTSAACWSDTGAGSLLPKLPSVVRRLFTYRAETGGGAPRPPGRLSLAANRPPSSR